MALLITTALRFHHLKVQREKSSQITFNAYLKTATANQHAVENKTTMKL